MPASTLFRHLPACGLQELLVGEGGDYNNSIFHILTDIKFRKGFHHQAPPAQAQQADKEEEYLQHLWHHRQQPRPWHLCDWSRRRKRHYRISVINNNTTREDSYASVSRSSTEKAAAATAAEETTTTMTTDTTNRAATSTGRAAGFSRTSSSSHCITTDHSNSDISQAGHRSHRGWCISQNTPHRPDHLWDVGIRPSLHHSSIEISEADLRCLWNHPWWRHWHHNISGRVWHQGVDQLPSLRIHHAQLNSLGQQSGWGPYLDVHRDEFINIWALGSNWRRDHPGHARHIGICLFILIFQSPISTINDALVEHALVRITNKELKHSKHLGSLQARTCTSHQAKSVSGV